MFIVESIVCLCCFVFVVIAALVILFDNQRLRDENQELRYQNKCLHKQIDDRQNTKPEQKYFDFEKERMVSPSEMRSERKNRKDFVDALASALFVAKHIKE